MQNTLCSETIEAMSKKAHKRRINQLTCSFLERFPRSHTPADASALLPENSHVDMASLLPRPLRRVVFNAASSSLKLAYGGVHVSEVVYVIVRDIIAALLMARRNRLPRNMTAGILGAEVATWAAIWPSLLPRPWWVTALNVAIGQAVGHFFAASAAFGLKNILHAAGKRPQDHL